MTEPVLSHIRWQRWSGTPELRDATLDEFVKAGRVLAPNSDTWFYAAWLAALSEITRSREADPSWDGETGAGQLHASEIARAGPRQLPNQTGGGVNVETQAHRAKQDDRSLSMSPTLGSHPQSIEDPTDPTHSNPQKANASHRGSVVGRHSSDSRSRWEEM
ncbi:hypothetical protein [Enhygromyxa salina]|uniref:hypothetical protein n=1 Tax=Enhygromyxa salina TaxID=215803 RepID=UPI0015E64356|nr:hypothetical protein [Enhygromyxa salina]